MSSSKRMQYLGTEYARIHTDYFNNRPEGELIFRNGRTKYRVVDYRATSHPTTTVEKSYSSAASVDYGRTKLCVLYLEDYGMRWFSCIPSENREYELIYDAFHFIDTLPVG